MAMACLQAAGVPVPALPSAAASVLAGPAGLAGARQLPLRATEPVMLPDPLRLAATGSRRDGHPARHCDPRPPADPSIQSIQSPVHWSP